MLEYESLSVLTWNVHSCQSASKEPSLKHVARVIRNTGARVVALQEVDEGCLRTGKVDQSAELAERLEMRHHFYPLVDWRDFPSHPEPEGRYGLAVLCDPALESREFGRLSLPTLSETNEPRGVFQIAIEWNESRLIVLNTHLSVARRERMLQLQTLHRQLEKLESDGERTVLMGDFNSPGPSPGLSRLRRLVAECAPAGLMQPTFPSRFPVFRLDRIFLSRSLKGSTSRVVAGPLAVRASDHLPVHVTLNGSHLPSFREQTPI